MISKKKLKTLAKLPKKMLGAEMVKADYNISFRKAFE